MKTASSKSRSSAMRSLLIENGERAGERDFPIKQISLLAERESWRKEINRPIYHIHKWWAQRLGSVFRAVILGALADADTDIWASFYKHHDFSGKIVLDPFMGSGTTLGECAKLGAKPVGTDINPVSSFIVRQALTRVDLSELRKTFQEIEADVGETIRGWYKTLDPVTGEEIPLLYCFWVKEVEAPNGERIPLFNSHVFSKDAYPNKKPLARIVCSRCWSLNVGRYDATDLTCESCGLRFNPQVGPARGQHVVDASGNRHKIKDLISGGKTPPKHRLYALLALRRDGTKTYLAPTDHDFRLFEQARSCLADCDLPLPEAPIRPGHNTDQARGYNYLYWRDFFNERQLLCLGILLKRILRIENTAVRDQFLCLFSGVLEFNNLFCSFKGEGTGAVRHLFSHHVFKPERTPLENSVWGTDKSSGTFSTLFHSRLMKAKAYLDSPFEIQVSVDGRESNEKIVCSPPLDLTVTETWNEFLADPKSALVLNGDGARLPLPNNCVDAVVTDPPYFDFVHYSELSDFFYAWLSPVLRKEYASFSGPDSSNEREVQDRVPEQFVERLAQVFRECRRVLKPDGLLIFSFHHSRIDGWMSIYKAVTEAGFTITASHPIYGEMKGANPKASTKEPIVLDALLVCRTSDSSPKSTGDAFNQVSEKVETLLEELRSAGISLSRADDFVVKMSQSLTEGSRRRFTFAEMSKFLNQIHAA